MPQQAHAIRWRYGFVAALALALLALLPQLHLWLVRGRDWRGSYVSFDFDEVAYEAYLSALSAGRPRRNDPYTGRADVPGAAIPESAYTIQFVPAYALALPARALNLSAATVFILLNPLAILAAALALFWLLRQLTDEPDADLTAAAGVVCILCLGVLVEATAHARVMLGLRDIHSTMPFLRRYVPALAFPLYFIFCGLVLRALSAHTRRAALVGATLAGCTFAGLVFSYFFLWTAAAAWLALFALLWLIMRRADRRHAIIALTLVGALALLALAPYALLLARRAPEMDAAQLLLRSHAPVVARLPVLLGLTVLLLLVVAGRRGRIEPRAPATICIAAFALLPLLLFNQQIVTGRSLQPLHYARYIANYAAAMASFLTLLHIWRAPARRRRARVLVCLALVAFGWSCVETCVRAVRLAQHNAARDERRLIALRIAALPHDALDNERRPAQVVFCSDLALADMLPTVGGGPVLWSQHMPYFSGAARAEVKTRLYQHLYYSGVDEPTFASLAGPQTNSFLRLALFGWERMDAAQTGQPSVTTAEVQQEARAYAAYAANFTRATAAAPPLNYVVTPADAQIDLTNLDHWYERDAGERIGDFRLYRVRLRP